MKISEKGLTMIESFEGCLLKASNKLDGVWTIGYGQTGSYYGKRVHRGMTTTKAEAHAWLRDHSIKTYEDAVTQAVKVPLNQHQFDALVSFAYNVGVGAMAGSTAVRKLNAGDYAGAADALTMWTKCNGKVLAGLVRRRKEERALFLAPATQTNTASPDLLRKGDRGDDVKLLQHRLNILGWQLTEDGIWGVQTDSAVRGYQYRAGLTVDGIVGAKTKAALIRDAILARAAEIGAYMVKHKWRYQDKTYRAKSTFNATKALEHPGATCSHFVSWVLQDVGLLTAGKRISHDGGKVTGTGNLLGCQVIQAKGKPWDKLADLRPGDVCVWDSNLAIYAGNGKWYDAGGPFRSNTKDGCYTNIGPIAPYYDRTEPVYYLVRAKV
ncbi:glycoside hydrolase family protein [Dysosmobacter sp.]|uniref:glycoside hydrolase family protein n=1 Tax=Dysosmobacter sp. TaxID=2591382 RepID=UPI003A8DCCBF